MEFRTIDNDEDMINLMQEFGYFHDSCIKEIKYVSGGYVGRDYAMNPFNSKRNLCVIFQRQSEESSVIELVFEELIKLNLEPSNGDYDCIIFEASLKRVNGIFYWCEWENFSLSDLDNVNGTWISSNKVKWRVLEDALGEEEIFISKL